MTFEQAFSKIKEKFGSVDKKKLDEDFAIQVNMTDADCGGAFYIQSAQGSLNVEPYDYHDNTADVTLKKLDLYKILDGKMSVSEAVESGKIYVRGNAEHFAKAAAAIVRASKPEAVKKAVKKSAGDAKKAVKKAAPKAKKAAEKVAEKAAPVAAAAEKLAEKAVPAAQKLAKKAVPAAKDAAEKAAEKVTSVIKKEKPAKKK